MSEFKPTGKMIAAMILLGSLITIGLGTGIGYGVSALLYATPDGSSFENTDDLRAAIKKDSEQPLPAGKSVPLRSILKTESSDEIIFSLKPNLHVKFQGVLTKTNKFGLRGTEIQKKKPEGVFRVALLGDSFAFGWGVEYEKTFAHLLEQSLSEALGKKVEVLNFGVPGYSTFQEVAILKEQGLAFEPDAVLLFFVENDFGLPFMIKNFDDKGKLQELTGKKSRNHFQKFKGLEDNDWSYLDFINPNSQFKELLTLTKSEGMELFVAINPNKQAQNLRQRLWILNVEKEINEIPMRKEFLRIIEEQNLDHKDLVLKTDPHPSALAHAIYANILSEAMAKQLLNSIKPANNN